MGSKFMKYCIIWNITTIYIFHLFLQFVFSELFKRLEVVFQWIFFISDGFRVKLDCNKLVQEEALVDIITFYYQPYLRLQE
jgi:hypothetical protein